MAAYFSLKDFTKDKSDIHVRIGVGNRATPAEIKTIRGPWCQDLLTITHEIRHYCLSPNITITAEYLPGNQNTETDYQSRGWQQLSTETPSAW